MYNLIVSLQKLAREETEDADLNKMIPLCIAVTCLATGCSNSRSTPEMTRADATQTATRQKVENDPSVPPQVRQMMQQQEVHHRQLPGQ